MTSKDLKYCAVIQLKKRQDVNQVAETLYRQQFTGSEKIKVREEFREGDKIIFRVSDFNERESLFLIK